jgi:hypothetical protein
MRRKGFAIVAAAALAAAAAVPLGAQTRLSSTADVVSYFPLRVGNEWVYAVASQVERSEWRAAVTGRKVAPNGAAYFELAGYFGPTRLVRSGLRGTVSELNPDGNRDNLWYLLGASVGTSWELVLEPLPTMGPMADCISGSKAVLASRSEVVRVPAGEFRDVVRVDYRAPCADAGLASEYFAPGVGLVKRVEQTFAGPRTSELVRARIGDGDLPRLPYASALELDSPHYVNNLMPIIGPDSLPVVRGAYVLRNRTSLPVELIFSGCKSVTVRVLNEAGEVVAQGSGNDGGCCACDNVFRFTLANDALALPFAFRLATPEGRPLADGRYSVEATLDALEMGRTRPSASAPIRVSSIY